MATRDRVPPQSLESERGLLGALLLKPDALHDVADIVQGDSFYAEKHKLIYEAMRELSERGEPIDLLSLSEHLSRTHRNHGLASIILSTGFCRGLIMRTRVKKA